MGTIQVPGRLSGRTYTVNIKGDTPSETEQARIRAMVEERESLFAQRYESQIGKPLAAPDDGTALGRGIARGVPQVKSALGTTLETVGQQLGLAGLAEYGRGMEQDAARRLFDLSLQQPAPTTREDVAAAEGFFPTIGKALTFAGELAGEQAPQLGAGLAGGAAGAGAGFLAAGPVGALAGFGVGSGLTEAPMLFGANVQRQEEEVAAGRKEAVDLTDALGATIGQAALTSVTNALAGAGVFVRPGARLFTRAVSGAAVGGTTEGLNEIGQQMLERYQAGLPVDSPDAIKEYIDAGVAGGILGLGAGGLGGAIAGRRPQEEVPPSTLSLPTPTKPGPAKIQSVTRRGPRVGPATTTTVRLDDGTTLTLQGDATEADIARAVDQHNQTKAAAETPAAPKAPTSEVEDIPEAKIIPDEGRPTGGVSIDEDLAAARKVYDDALAFALDLDTSPEKAKELAAQQTVNYIDSLQEETRKRLARFRNTMARFAAPAGSTRGVMPPDLPDSAYTQEFGEAVQKDLFTAPEPQPTADAPPKVAEQPVLQTWETLKPGDKVTLYRGENQDNVQGGDWWTTNPEKAAQYGAVRSFTADAVEVGKTAVQGHGGTDEFYFPNGVPERFLAAETRDTAPAADTRPAAPAPGARTSKKYTVSTEDAGDFEVRVTRLPDGSATVFTDDATQDYPAEFAASKSDEDLMAYQLEPLGYKGVKDDTTPAEAQPEAVGTGTEDRGRGVEQRGELTGDVLPAEGVETPESGGLGGDLSVPVGADTAAGAEPDSLTQLEERLAAARARAAELRKKVPAGVLQRELVGGKIDPALAKRVENLQNVQNVLNRQQKTADTAREAIPKKPTHPARPKKLAQYEAALAKVRETQAQLAAAQDALGAAELAADLRRGAEAKAPMTDKVKAAYTAYFNALKDADTIRQAMETARGPVSPEEPAPLPTGLREPVIPDTFLTYQSGITSKPVRPSKAPTAVAEAMQKEQVLQRLVQFFLQRASDALKRYTTARGGINSPTTWKSYPDWMPLADQFKVVQLLGRLNRKEREKYKFTASEVEPLSPDAEAAHTYFSKTIRPVDAIDMMLADLSADYEIYEGSLRPGLTEIEHRDLMMGTGSEVAKRALNWVRANLSPETNAEIDLSLKKQADRDAVTADWIGAEGTDRVAKGREARKEARQARAQAAEESGYDAGSIVRKMAAGDSRVALDQEMHYSVKAALNAGDLKGALRALADTTSNPELKALANRFAELVGTTRVRVLYPGDSAKYIGNDRGVYVAAKAGADPKYENTILINGQTGMTNHVLMHEMAHAVSSKFINANPTHPVVKQLEALLSDLREVGPKRDWYTADGRTTKFTYPNEFYGLTNVAELVAEGYGRLSFGETDNGLRDLMKRTRLRGLVDRQVEFENPLTAWERFKEIAANILNAAMRRPLTRRPRTKRTETIQVYETAADRFHRLVDGLLSEAPQVLPDSVLQAAVTKPLIGRNVLNNAVLNADTWSPAGRKRLGNLMSSSVPQGLRGALLGLLQLDWFNDLAGGYFPQIAKLKMIDDLRRGKINTLNGNVKPVLEDLLTYAQKSPELYAELMGIQGQATLANVDPTRPVSDYGADQEKVRVWHELNRKLAADSTGEMRRLFKKTRNILRAYRTEVERVLKSRVKDITDDTVKQNQLFAQLMQKLDEENAIDPYFSLMRRGDYWLEYTAEDTTAAPVATDPLGRSQRPTTRFVQAFESPFALAQFRAQLEAKRDDQGNPVAWDFEENPRPISDINRDGYVPPAFVQGALNVISAFEDPNASLEAKAKVKDARDAIHSMFLRLTPDHSLLKSFIKRKGTRGFIGDITPLGVIDAPLDMVQALADKTAALSYQLTNIEYGGKIQNLINSAGETRNKLAKSGGMTLGEKAAIAAYHDEFVKRAKFAKTPQVTGAAQLARGITFNMTLGFSIAGAVNNLMQIPMIGATELAGRYGMGASLRELGFAMRALKNAGKTQQVLSYGPDGREVRELDNVDNFGSLANYFTPDESGKFQLRTDMKIPAALRDKLADLDVLAEVLSNNGMLNASMSQEMLEAESGWLHKINRWGGFLMHHAERFNRQSMAIAAYNLELGKTKGRATPEAKLAAAKKAVEIAERVNGTIGASTAPRFAQSAIGSVVFMFKRFGLHMARYIINTTLRALKRIEPGMSAAEIEEAKKERAVARYQIIGMLGTTALFAGVQGLPFFSELMTIFNVFFTDDDEERPEVIVQKFLGEPYYHGALNYLLGVEIASRISMSGLIFRENKIEKDQSVLYDLFEMFGGPAVGVFMNTERGSQLLSEGEFYRGVETMMPSALKSLLKAFRFSTEGATTLRGDEVIPLTPADVVKQALGYTPVDYARQQERVSGAKRIDEAVRNRKRKLLRRYNLALADGDFAEAREALADMQEFSRQHPEDAITSDTINRSSRSFRQRSTEMISGVSFTPAGRARAQQYIDEFDQDTTLWGQ